MKSINQWRHLNPLNHFQNCPIINVWIITMITMTMIMIIERRIHLLVIITCMILSMIWINVCLADVVISGGGLKYYYVCGALAVLQKQLLNTNISIKRYSGASAGAWSASKHLYTCSYLCLLLLQIFNYVCLFIVIVCLVFMCLGFTTATVLEYYHRCSEQLNKVY